MSVLVIPDCKLVRLDTCREEVAFDSGDQLVPCVVRGTQVRYLCLDDSLKAAPTAQPSSEKVSCEMSYVMRAARRKSTVSS